MKQVDCDKILPALMDIENHFEQRLASIDELKTSYKIINELVPSTSENSKKFNEASSIIHNFYICIEFIFTEIPNVCKLFFNSETGAERSTVQNIFSIFIQMSFRLMLIGLIFLIAPKTIWKLHLFLMKAIIVFSCMVLCVGFYNYVTHFILSLQYKNLRHNIDENNIAINFVRYTKNIWSVEQFQAAKIQRNVDFINKASQQHRFYKQQKLNIPEQASTNIDHVFDKMKLDLKELLENSKISGDYAVKARSSFEKSEHVIKMIVDIIDQSQDMFNYEHEIFYQVLNKSQSFDELLKIVPNILELEDNVSNYKTKVETLIKANNKILDSILQHEADHGKVVTRAGTLTALVGVATMSSYPYLGLSQYKYMGALGMEF